MSLGSRKLAFVEVPTSYRVDSSKVVEVLCHRLKDGQEEYLIGWQTASGTRAPSPEAICSWHGLFDLSTCLHLVQKYLETRNRSPKANGSGSPHPLKRKRKSHENDPGSARDSRLGTNSPHLKAATSRSASLASRNSSLDAARGEVDSFVVYNGILEKREGCIVAKKSKRAGDDKINSNTLPTPEMVQRAANTPTSGAERHIRLAFERKLSKLRKLRLVNDIDSSTPSLEFTLISDYVTGEDVYRGDPEAWEGCSKPCHHHGCDSPRECKCLEYAAVNEDALRREDAKLFAEYMQAKQTGEGVGMRNLPKRFPYHVAKGPQIPQTLVSFYREQRHPIYECNPNCACGPGCKSRVVQKGRKVPLTIFKTPNCGWGVRCDEELIQGEFVDTYIGEIITNEEAGRREKTGSVDKQSYLYSLDKWINDEYPDLTEDTCYVVDGQYMGGPTRFINHSCEPNCRQYTVSYDKNNPRVYDIAFFAVTNIPAGTELTFDYQDLDEVEEDVAVATREAKLRDPANARKQRCNCGATKCRGFLWE